MNINNDYKMNLYQRNHPIFAYSSISSSSTTSLQKSTTPFSSMSVSAASATTNSNDKKSESPVVKFVISGVAAWVYELVIGHYLEFVKIAKQTNAHKTYAQLTSEMIKSKGIIGVLDGYFPWGTLQALSKGAVFGFAHAASASYLQPYVRDGTVNHIVAEVIAGGIGGGFQGVVLSPLLLLKTRVMTDPIFRQNMDLRTTTKESARVGMNVIRKEGPLALMKGSIVFSGKRVADWSTRYMFAEGIEYYMKGGDHNVKLSTLQQTSASFLGGTLSTLVTLPIDVMVAQIQQASKAGQKVGVIDTFRTQLQQGGIMGTLSFSTRGFIARTFHVSLTTVIMKTGSSYLYSIYRKISGDS